MFSSPLSTLFGSVGLTYGLLFPFFLLQLLSLLFIASLIHSGAKAKGVAAALYCYLVMSGGVLLMTLAALPTIASVFSGRTFSPATYVGLLFVFGIGGLLYLTHETQTQKIDFASRAVPSLIFFYGIKLIGMAVIVLSGISLILTFTTGANQMGWWIMPFTTFLYGLFLLWATRSETVHSGFFQSFQIHPPVLPKRAVASRTKKARVSKPKKRPAAKKRKK